MLYLVPTPIGNLKDVSLRALDTLQNVQLILAEDTRESRKLLNHYSIQTPVQSYHAFNEHRITESIIAKLKDGVDIALISDAGTPGVSDPGFLLVRACYDNQITVSPLPGATAFVPALVASGISSDRFHFEGFLPHKKGRHSRWVYLSSLDQSFILYESPHRVLKCVKEIIKYCGEQRTVCLARELTKIHEELIRTNALELFEILSARDKIKGEIVVVVAGKKAKPLS